MKRILRVAATVLVVTALLAAVLLAATYLLSNRKQHRLVEITVTPIDFADYEDSAGRGQYLYETRGCRECHGDNGAGRVVIDAAENGLYVRSPNITRGAGSVAGSYSDTDWVRLLRHGIKPSHMPVFVMPAEDSARLSDEDVAALATYVRNLPAVSGAGAGFRLPLALRAMYVLGVFKDAAEKIDHATTAAKRVVIAATAQYGEYVADTCIGCHGPKLAGGKIPGAPPSWPSAANLTSAPDSAMSRYASLAEFHNMIRTGRRPDGSEISGVMPFDSLGGMSDVEIEALFLFLKSLEPQPLGQR